MRPVDNETRLTMDTRRNFVNYAKVWLSSNTTSTPDLELTPADFRISGNSFTDDWCDGESFQIGTAIGKTATILLDNTNGRTEVVGTSTVTYPHGKFSNYDFYMAYFQLFVCLPDAYHYNGELKDQMIPIGIFTVTNPVANSSTIEITGVDNMYMFDRSFDDCTLDFSSGVTLLTILNRCCSDCGVAIGYSSFNNQSITVNEKPENVTYRQVVSWIAQIAGCNAVIDNSGALKLKWYDTSTFSSWLDGGTFSTTTTPYSDGDSADGGYFDSGTPVYTSGDSINGGDFTTPLDFHNLKYIKSTQVSTDDIHFTGVTIKNDATEAHYPASGWEGYVLEITDNPFVKDHESTIAQYIYGRLQNLSIRPFSCSSVQDPTIEAGDCALVYDTKGNTYPTVITNVEFTTGGYTEIDCKADSPLSQNSRYINPASQAVIQTERKMDEYNAQVAHFNELANEALGYYRTDAQEGSATVTYIHDQPTLNSSQIVWKITVSGIFVTENYNPSNPSWTSGYDTSTATMLMNLIYAHGITADWINAGQLFLSGKDGGVTFEAYNYFYWVYQKTVPTTVTSIILNEFENEYSPIIDVIEKNETITATLSLLDNGTTVSSETITLTTGENTFNLKLPARYNSINGYIALINFSAFTGTFTITVKGYHYAFDIRPNNFVVNNSKFCDAYCYNFLADQIESLGNVIGNSGVFNTNAYIPTIYATSIMRTTGQAYLNLDTPYAGTGYFGTIRAKSGYINIINPNLSGGIDMQGSTSTVGFSPDSAQFLCSQSGSQNHYIQWTNYSSDRDLKENIRPVDEEYTENFFSTVEPVRFNFKDDKDNDYIGLIAQDLQEVFNTVGLNNEKIVYKDPFNHYAIDYTMLVGHLVSGVKDLYAEINKLKAEIEKLKNPSN